MKQRHRRERGDWIAIWSYVHYSQQRREGIGRVPNLELEGWTAGTSNYMYRLQDTKRT